MARAWALVLAAALLAAGSVAADNATLSCKEAPKTATCVSLGATHAEEGSAGNVIMWWWVSKTTKTITMKAVSLGEWGWIGLGLSESGGMRAADIALVTLGGDNSTGSVEDMYSVKYGMPVRDEKQSWQLLEASVGGGRTQVKLRRKLDTCDDQDIEVMQGVEQWVIWARGDSWPQKHKTGNVGNGVATLYPFSKAQRATISAGIAQLPANHPEALNATHGGKEEVTSLDLQFPADTVVPVKDDAYMCKAYRMPDKVMHATAFRALLPTDEDSRAAIHHMVLYGCSSAPTKVTEAVGVVPCGAVPEFTCSRFITVWTPGQSVSYLPEEAGLLTGATDRGLEWVILQLHYSNLDLTPGLNGSAGIRIEMTPKLRPYEVGTLVLGNLDLKLPPGEAAFAVDPAYCPPGCTKRFASSMKIINSMGHQHRAGQAISTRLIRDGKELQPLMVKKAFDFQYQTFTEPPSDLKSQFLVPGDALLTQCVYNTEGRKNTTWWGEDTSSEMCFNFILYYPRDPYLETCLTSGPMDEGMRPLLPQFGLDPKGDYDMYMCSNFETISSDSDFNETQLAALFRSGDLGLAPRAPKFTPWADPHCKNNKAGRRLL